jgi:hypothetical protein
MFTERDMQDIFVQHPEIIEDGLVFREKEQTLYGRRIDIRCTDSKNSELIIELKNTEITYEHIGQIIWYTGALIREGKKAPRTMLIGRKIHPVLKTAFDRYGIEWREFTPEQLVSELKIRNSSLYVKYQHLDGRETHGRKVKVSPIKENFNLGHAELNEVVANKFSKQLLTQYIPVQRIGDYFLIHKDAVETVTKNTGYWTGQQRRFVIVGKETALEGTLYLGTSGGDGKKYYPEGANPVYLSIDIGYASKSGELFKPSNHTHALKLPVHEYVSFPSGNLLIELPVKGPGVKESKDFIFNLLDKYNVPLTHPINFEDEKSIIKFVRAGIAVGLVKLMAKGRIKQL